MAWVYESATVEPGGWELEDRSALCACPVCKRDAIHRYVERAEGGSLNIYDWVDCRHCGKQHGEIPDDCWWGPSEDELRERASAQAQEDDRDRERLQAIYDCYGPAIRFHRRDRGDDLEDEPVACGPYEIVRDLDGSCGDVDLWLFHDALELHRQPGAVRRDSDWWEPIEARLEAVLACYGPDRR